jgi:hypothetical protein
VFFTYIHEFLGEFIHLDGHLRAIRVAGWSLRRRSRKAAS